MLCGYMSFQKIVSFGFFNISNQIVIGFSLVGKNIESKKKQPQLFQKPWKNITIFTKESIKKTNGFLADHLIFFIFLKILIA